jgi:AAHS family 4-hydroxybenzoate transporter-like MFS transporter
VGGILLALNLSSQVLFGVFAIPAMLAVICSVCLRRAPERSGMTDDYAHSPKIGAQAINDVRG